jgi:hypothetical protein
MGATDGSCPAGPTGAGARTSARTAAFGGSLGGRIHVPDLRPDAGPVDRRLQPSAAHPSLKPGENALNFALHPWVPPSFPMVTAGLGGTDANSGPPGRCAFARRPIGALPAHDGIRPERADRPVTSRSRRVRPATRAAGPRAPRDSESRGIRRAGLAAPGESNGGVIGLTASRENHPVRRPAMTSHQGFRGVPFVRLARLAAQGVSHRASVGEYRGCTLRGLPDHAGWTRGRVFLGKATP